MILSILFLFFSLDYGYGIGNGNWSKKLLEKAIATINRRTPIAKSSKIRTPFNQSSIDGLFVEDEEDNDFEFALLRPDLDSATSSTSIRADREGLELDDGQIRPIWCAIWLRTPKSVLVNSSPTLMAVFASLFEEFKPTMMQTLAWC